MNNFEIKLINLPDLYGNKKHITADNKSLPTEAGVYFLLDENGKIIYVGQTTNLQRRMKSHLTKNSFVISKNNNVPPKYFYFIKEENTFKRRALELLLIDKFKPNINKILIQKVDEMDGKINVTSIRTSTGLRRELNVLAAQKDLTYEELLWKMIVAYKKFGKEL